MVNLADFASEIRLNPIVDIYPLVIDRTISAVLEGKTVNYWADNEQIAQKTMNIIEESLNKCVNSDDIDVDRDKKIIKVLSSGGSVEITLYFSPVLIEVGLDDEKTFARRLKH